MNKTNEVSTIINALLASGLSYTGIAARLDVTEITIRRWRSDKNKPHNLFLKELRKMKQNLI